MKKATIFIVSAFLLMLCAVPVYADDIPPLPHAFYGALEVNGSDAEPGYTVEARGEGVTTGIAGNPIVTEEVGRYGSADPLGAKLIVQGDISDGATITFYVDSEPTGQTTEWHSSEITEFDLSVTIARAPGGGGGGALDTTPPRISDILMSNITETSADISWTTQELSDSQVEYWSSPGEFSPLDPEMIIYHLVYLTDLTPGTTYYYRTMSRDRAGNLAVSDEHTFTTLGELPAAVFAFTRLFISLGEVNIGETVTISVLVTNTGNTAGSFEVTLKINGEVETTKEVTLNAGASEEVTFATAKDVPGSYSVDVQGLSGSFTVREKPAPPPVPPLPPTPPLPPVPPTPPPAPAAPVVNWPLLWGVIGGVIVVGVVIFLVLRKRRA